MTSALSSPLVEATAAAGSVIHDEGEVNGLVFERFRPIGNPDAPRLVMVLGTQDRAAKLKPAVEMLDDYDITIFDRRGWGASAGAGTCSTLDEVTADLETVIGDEPAIVIGLSFGGFIAFSLRERRPDLFTGLGVWEMPLIQRFWPEDLIDLTRQLSAMPGEEVVCATFGGVERVMSMNEKRRAAILAEGPAAKAESGLLVADHPEPDFSKVDVPALFAYGFETAFAPEIEATTFAASQTPGAHLIGFPGVGHLVHRSNPDVFARFVRMAVANTQLGYPSA